MDSPKLKPCPHCGSTDLQVCWNSVYEDHYVRCQLPDAGLRSTEERPHPKFERLPAATRSRPTTLIAQAARRENTGPRP